MLDRTLDKNRLAVRLALRRSSARLCAIPLQQTGRSRTSVSAGARQYTQRVFRYADYFRAQVERSEISFDTQDFHYIIFDYYEGDTKPATAIAGVRVSKHGATQMETELQCRGKALNKLGRLKTVIPADADNPLNR